MDAKPWLRLCVLLAEDLLEYLKKHDVRVQKITDQNHSALGIIDRFIRTLRDMHGTQSLRRDAPNGNRSKCISSKQMQKYLHSYNNSIHSSIGCTPKEMLDDLDLEEKYILENIDKREKQRSMKGFELDEGEHVKYLLPRNKLEKKRFRYSPEAYIISGRDGNNYILSAKDGTTITRPRFQLVKVSGVKVAETIPGKWRGIVKEVIGDVGKNKVRVKFEVPGEKDYEDIIARSYLRSRFNLSGLDEK